MEQRKKYRNRMPELNKVIVFAHMMKTAGTSLNKFLIGHFSKNMHIVPGIIAGHPLRPYKDYDDCKKRLQWITFFRTPAERFVSHYLYDYKLTNHFSYKRYKNMRNSSIIEWEKLEHNSNYQTKFIAGETNFDKAVEIIETKMKWVGLTEEFENSLCSFKTCFELKNFSYKDKVTNSTPASLERKQKVAEEYTEFINEKNVIDLRLYNYVKKNVYPKFKMNVDENYTGSGKANFIDL